MLQTLNPYPSTAKTAEIMARYRPIAPKPDLLANSVSEMTPNITQSPYLRNVWPHLQARPTRTRKRGRTSVGPPANKRSRTFLQGLSPPPQLTTSPAKNLSLQAFAHSPNGLPHLPPVPSLAGAPVTTQATLVTLPLLPCPTSLPIATEFNGGGQKAIDLNMAAEVPQEKDFLCLLQGPTSTTTVIAPQAVRPVGSSITIRSIGEDPSPTPAVLQVPKIAEEVEEEIESESIPAVVTDSNNKVRLVNSAYKEMVGQPECLWLDSMVTCDARHGGVTCKRICGEVMFQFPDSGLPISSNGFSSWAMIEWGNNGNKRSVDTDCKAIRLCCESKDYLLAWRFHTREVSESTSSV